MERGCGTVDRKKSIVESCLFGGRLLRIYKHLEVFIRGCVFKAFVGLCPKVVDDHGQVSLGLRIDRVVVVGGLGLDIQRGDAALPDSSKQKQPEPRTAFNIVRASQGQGHIGQVRIDVVPFGRRVDRLVIRNSGLDRTGRLNDQNVGIGSRRFVLGLPPR